jgi:hypothetical protein
MGVDILPNELPLESSTQFGYHYPGLSRRKWKRRKADNDVRIGKSAAEPIPKQKIDLVLIYSE